MTTGFSGVPRTGSDIRGWVQRLSDSVNGILQGKINATVQITLNASATSTVINDARIGANTFFDFCPLTADAATAKPGIYVTNRTKGSATLNHASSANADQTFLVLLIG